MQGQNLFSYWLVQENIKVTTYIYIDKQVL